MANEYDVAMISLTVGLAVAVIAEGASLDKPGLTKQSIEAANALVDRNCAHSNMVSRTPIQVTESDDIGFYKQATEVTVKAEPSIDYDAPPSLADREEQARAAHFDVTITDTKTGDILYEGGFYSRSCVFALGVKPVIRSGPQG